MQTKNWLTSVEYIAHLEGKINRLEKLLHGQSQRPPSGPAAEDSNPGDVIESLVRAHDGNDSPKYPVDTDFGGLKLLDRLNDLCEHVTHVHHSHQSHHDDHLSAAFDLAPPEFRPSISWEAYASLPSRFNIYRAIAVVLNISCCNLQFLDKDDLHRITDEVLEAADEGSTEESPWSLCLIFGVLALARRFEAMSAVVDGDYNKHRTSRSVQSTYDTVKEI